MTDSENPKARDAEAAENFLRGNGRDFDNSNHYLKREKEIFLAGVEYARAQPPQPVPLSGHDYFCEGCGQVHQGDPCKAAVPLKDDEELFAEKDAEIERLKGFEENLHKAIKFQIGKRHEAEDERDDPRAKLAKTTKKHKKLILQARADELKLNQHIDFIEKELEGKERDLANWEEQLGVLAGKMGIDISGCYDMGDVIGQIDAWLDNQREVPPAPSVEGG